MNEKQERPKAAIASIILAAVLIVGSLWWLIGNLEDVFGYIFDRDDPVPTEVVSPEGAVDAVLYAECQEQLEEVLISLGPIATEGERVAAAEYLAEARYAQMQMRDLIIRGNVLFDELLARDGDTPDEYIEDWNHRAYEFRFDLYKSIQKMRDLGPDDAFVRVHSELFLAYSWLDRYSDQVNGFFSTGESEGVDKGPLQMAERHLNTVEELLNR